ncbi:MAG: aspartate--ammonia ligase [Firmicutes bacterium]|nr:aspartate--ammonia ligase [Bacillota bacterium]
MREIIMPVNYNPGLGIRETEIAIKFIKDYFESALAQKLNLTRVSAPLFVRPESGLNDNLNGVERPVAFDLLDGGINCEIVHSLAKWKRLALKRYGFLPGEGLYTDMNAIRRDEETDNLHSVYVDQWDWEKIIPRESRNIGTLKAVVRDIYSVILDTEAAVHVRYPEIPRYLPPEISFVISQELEDSWPDSSPKERENAAARAHGAVFLTQIGGALRSGKPHDGRAPDYDDWSLNGDILVYYPLFDRAVEISSMGIRVDGEALRRQLEIRGCPERAALPFQKALLNGELPQTIGGGIGQSRMCLLFLHKAHIGEVQSSVWPEEQIGLAREHGITLL